MDRRDFVRATAAALAVGGTTRDAQASNPLFSFHSDFWVNLHHTLYRQADALQAAYQGGPQSLGPIQKRFYDDLALVSGAARPAWYRALAYYQAHYGGRAFFLDDGLIRVENELADAGPGAELKAVIEPIAPAYRHVLWPAHDARNRARIRAWQAHLVAYGPAVLPRLARLYQAPWLAKPYRVDVVVSTDRDGAFSIDARRDWHIVASSLDHQGTLQGFEVILHEASHSLVSPDDGPIGRAIARAAVASNRPEPADLWHVVLMYVPGRVLREYARRAGNAYTPAFDGVMRTDYPHYEEALEAHFQPYVDGRVELDVAMADTVRAIVEPSASHR